MTPRKALLASALLLMVSGCGASRNYDASSDAGRQNLLKPLKVDKDDPVRAQERNKKKWIFTDLKIEAGCYNNGMLILDTKRTAFVPLKDDISDYRRITIYSDVYFGVEISSTLMKNGDLNMTYFVRDGMNHTERQYAVPKSYHVMDEDDLPSPPSIDFVSSKTPNCSLKAFFVNR